jgi:hypothetical protein
VPKWATVRRNQWIAGGIAAAIVVAVGLFLALGGGGGSQTLRGEVDTVTVLGSSVSDGDQVVVKDAGNKTVGTAAISTTDCKGKGAALFSCFTFTVKDLSDSDFYSIHIGEHGPATVKRNELAKNGWHVTLTV